MSKTLSSLAFLRVNWDHYKKDFVENFVPLAALLMSRRNYDAIDPKTLCQDFRDEYGLLIPQYAMMTILTRAKNRGLIERRAGIFKPSLKQINLAKFSKHAEDQVREYNKLIAEFVRFCKDVYEKTLDSESADHALLSVIDKRSLDILSGAFEPSNREQYEAVRSGGVLPAAQSPKQNRYLAQSFICQVFHSEPGLASFLINVVLGHTLASALIYSDIDKYKTKLKRVCFYFDTRFLLRVLGTEGDDRQSACVELLELLRGQGARLHVFQHTYDEMQNILYNCLDKLAPTRYDPYRAGPTLRYFMHNDYKESDVETIIVRSASLLSEHRIDIVDTPDPLLNRRYQIDEPDLEQRIIAIYQSGDPYFDASSKKDSMIRDIKSITAVHMLRAGTKPRTLAEAGHIFVTTNSGLVRANREMESNINGSRYAIPVCLTDVFVGTLAWLHAPAKASEINQRTLIADCYAAIEPDDQLIALFVKEIERLKQCDGIGQEEYYHLRTSRAAMNLLADKTLGDPDQFTAKTAEEIREDIIKSATKRTLQLVERERLEHEKTREELKNTFVEKERLLKRADFLAHRASVRVSGSLYLLLVVFVTVGLVGSVPGLNLGQHFSRPFLWACYGIAVILGVLSVAMGFNIGRFRDSTHTWLRAKIQAFLTKPPR